MLFIGRGWLQCLGNVWLGEELENYFPSNNLKAEVPSTKLFCLFPCILSPAVFECSHFSAPWSWSGLLIDFCIPALLQELWGFSVILSKWHPYFPRFHNPRAKNGSQISQGTGFLWLSYNPQLLGLWHPFKFLLMNSGVLTKSLIAKASQLPIGPSFSSLLLCLT